jgi:hypothetical protein
VTPVVVDLAVFGRLISHRIKDTTVVVDPHAMIYVVVGNLAVGATYIHTVPSGIVNGISDNAGPRAVGTDVAGVDSDGIEVADHIVPDGVVGTLLPVGEYGNPIGRSVFDDIVLDQGVAPFQMDGTVIHLGIGVIQLVQDLQAVPEGTVPHHAVVSRHMHLTSEGMDPVHMNVIPEKVYGGGSGSHLGHMVTGIHISGCLEIKGIRYVIKIPLSRVVQGLQDPEKNDTPPVAVPVFCWIV